MSLNRHELEKKVSTVTSELLCQKGYVSFVDVFMELGYLSKADYESWRFRRVWCLEKVIGVNLAKINFIMKVVRHNCLNGGLKPRWTAYKSWGEGKKTDLRFSKSGNPTIEEVYATHFVKKSKVNGITTAGCWADTMSKKTKGCAR